MWVQVAADGQLLAVAATDGHEGLGTPHEDVAAALAHGFDGDRTLLRTPHVPVI